MRDLIINTIQEKLDKGIRIDLECIDRDGFEGGYSPNKTLFRNGEILTVDYINDDGYIEIKGLEKSKRTISSIIPDEFKYFRIKEQNKEDKEMKVFKLKIGDIAVVRNDLVTGKRYGELTFHTQHAYGEFPVTDIRDSEKFSEYELRDGGLNLYYSKEMIDWDKTRELNKKGNEVKEEKTAFDDLIDIAVQAVRDGLMVITYIGGNILKFEIVTPYPEFDKCYKVLSDQPENIKSHIEIIESLYTETFTIESEDDIKKIKEKATITLTNGSSSYVHALCAEGIDCGIRIGDSLQWMGFFILKGATVTQKVGK